MVAKSPVRPKKLSECGSRILVQFATKNRCATLADISNTSAEKVSAPKICKMLKNWTAEDWNKVVWTNESTFEIRKKLCQVCAWYKPGKEFNEECLVPTFKNGWTSLMIWSAIPNNKKSNLAFMVPGERNTQAFVTRCMRKFCCHFLDR